VHGPLRSREPRRGSRIEAGTPRVTPGATPTGTGMAAREGAEGCAPGGRAAEGRSRARGCAHRGRDGREPGPGRSCARGRGAGGRTLLAREAALRGIGGPRRGGPRQRVPGSAKGRRGVAPPGRAHGGGGGGAGPPAGGRERDGSGPAPPPRRDARGGKRKGREREREGERGGGSPWDPKSDNNRHRIT
jgi:hypothetical protein